MQFPIWVSSTQLIDRPGDIVEIDAHHLKPMAPIRTVLELPKSRRMEQVQVILETQLTEIGTLQLACRTQDAGHRWKLDFDVRSAIETDRQSHSGVGEGLGIIDEGLVEACHRELEKTFGPSPTLAPSTF